MSFPIKFQCKVPKDAPEQVAMYFEVRPEGKNRYLPLGRRIPVKFLTDKGKAINTTARGARRYADFVASEKLRLEQIWEDLRKEGYPLTFENLHEFFTTGKEIKPVKVEKQEELAKTTEFSAFVRAELAYEKALRERDDNQWLDSKTVVTYEVEVERLDDYHPNLTFEEITGEWISNYYDYCLERGGYSRTKDKARVPMESGSMHRVRKFLRKYLLRAVKKGILAKSPMDDARTVTIRHKEREYLSIDEVKELHKLYQSKELLSLQGKSNRARSVYGQNLQTVLWYSLAACYVGMRYSDWAEFDPNEHIRSGRIIKWIVKGGKKKQVVIPIRKPMQQLLDDVWKPGQPWPLKIPSNCVFNYRVKRVAEFAGIEKVLSAHCFRHTFAITSLVLGVRLETISDLLGHGSLKTTQIYARIVDEVRETQMDVWNDFFKDAKEFVTVHCQSCAEKLLEYPRGMFQVPTLPLTCMECSHQQTHHVEGQPALKVVA